MAPRARLLLDDAEWAALNAMAHLGLGAREAHSRAGLLDQTTRAGFAAHRIEAAIQSLIDKACLNDLGDGRLALTAVGADMARG